MTQKSRMKPDNRRARVGLGVPGDTALAPPCTSGKGQRRPGPPAKVKRNQAILRAVESGRVSLRQAAKRWGVSHWRIWYIVRRERERRTGV
jgi:hypothetical protein